jgi:acylphosphatase
VDTIVPEESGIRRVHLSIEGFVQGVGFRYAAERQATRLGVVGWVRNLSDGRVEAVFEGPSGAVDPMVEWARVGPAGADVSHVDIREELPEGMRGFSVRR